ncbi:hypothetical protein QFC22_000839 [Naganishia vaughanmartiniae]|uniref:Uncharacterized protein n=1 Tax=Naganishia vaughanmartiniae TaxID=1424756 RepID=A0ACC2XLZ6_9TREE|nr:hypothetical protein QFC22_000839 [Naganishia vaughanmartiniae]
MSFVDTYQVGSLRWRRDMRIDDIEEETVGFSITKSEIPASALSSCQNADGVHVDFKNLPRPELTQAVLAVCLNLGNAQSNKAKTEEGFFDPATRHHERAMRKIMANLASQFNSIQEMTVVALPDPRQETVIAALQRARRASPADQILFLYNDHGTLAPTSQGEIWVYDTDFPVTPTTYNPIFVSSLMDCTKAGTIYVWDCDNAGRVVDCALEHGKRKDLENRQRSAHLPQGIPSQLTHGDHDIHFGACATDQVLPVLDDLPRHQAKVDPSGSQRQIQDDIPGEMDNRNTPLGELNWLFTVIVDTIAWQSLPFEAFRTLFRTNNATRSLSRGYILVQRILRNYDCTPVCYPDIPSTHLHPLWQVWDTALEDFLCQLPIIAPSKGEFYVYRSPILFEELLQSMAAQLTLFANPDMNQTDCKTASRLCANALPIVFSACRGGRYRQWALNLLAWTSTHEASVAVFLLQRLTAHENGIHALITPHHKLHKPPINLLGDFIQQHISTESFNLSADTLAGILYLFTKAVEAVGCATTTDEFERQWNDILDLLVDAEDDFVRLWAVLAFASCPLKSVTEEKAVHALALTDESETVRIATAYAIWSWQGSAIASLHYPDDTDVEAELWADSKSLNEETEVSKNKLRKEQIMAYETGNRAIKSWTKHSMEIPTKHKSQLLRRSTIAKRTLPTREQGIAALYFVDQLSPGLDVIELSRQGIVRVVKEIETPVEDDSNIVRGFLLHDAVEEVRFNAAWNATNLELHVAINSVEDGFQIWDLGASRRKAWVATEFSASISCMDVERQRGNLNLAGFSDGTVALFDTRQQARRGVCRWIKGHKDAVLCTSLTTSQEIVSMGKDGVLQVWDLRVPSQSICSTAPTDSRLKKGMAAAAMGSTSVFAQLLQPTDSLPEVELSIHKLAFPAPAEIANITLSPSAFTDSTACMTFHPKSALLAVAERNKIVIRTANGER